MKKLLLFVFLIVLGTSSQAQLGNYSAGDTAPDWTVTDIHGNTHQLSTYTAAGKSVLIDFFYTTCGPCQTTAPKITDFYHKYGCNQSDVIVLGIDQGDNNAQVLAFENQYSGTNPYPACSGTEGGGNAVVSAYSPSAYPTIIIIGSDGTFKNTDVWPVGTIADIESAFSAANVTITPMACATGIEEADAIKETSLFPNPSSHQTTLIVVANEAGELDIEVYSVLGQQVSHIQSKAIPGNNTLMLDNSQLDSGLYFVRIKLNGVHSETIQMQVIN